MVTIDLAKKRCMTNKIGDMKMWKRETGGSVLSNRHHSFHPYITECQKEVIYYWVLELEVSFYILCFDGTEAVIFGYIIITMLRLKIKHQFHRPRQVMFILPING